MLRQSQHEITIATGGVTLFEAIKAAEQFEKEGIGVRVIDLFTIKPIDAWTSGPQLARGGRDKLIGRFPSVRRKTESAIPNHY